MVSVEQHATAESVMSQLTDVNVICIGSPRAFDISSFLLDRLFFPPGEDVQRDPPFRFFWATRAPQTRFTIVPENATQDALRQEIDQRGSDAAWAITIGEKAYLSKRNVSHGVSRFSGYGIATAAWVGGFVYTIYAGLSGPDSEALGKCTRELANFAGRPPHADGRSPVVWYLVESVIEGPEKPDPEQGDLRKLVDQKVISGPHYWMRA
jgi:hypothetical protein